MPRRSRTEPSFHLARPRIPRRARPAARPPTQGTAGHLALLAIVFLAAIAATWAPASSAKTEYGRMKEDPEHVRTWNAFADALFALHRHRLAGRKVRTEESTGGYGGSVGDPAFYREVEYFDAVSGQLLSRIQWERKNPDAIHVIEVFIYDDRGRVTRDYLAAYLPQFRNAPVQTLINLHDYTEGLHSFRQFDASGNRIYEQCRGRYFDRPVHISLEEDQLSRSSAAGAPERSPAYLACFEYLPLRAGSYLNPLTEIRSDPRAMEPGDAVRTSEHAEAELARLERQIAQEPTDARLYLARGQAQFDLRAFDAAIADFTTAIAHDEGLDEAYFWRGMALGRAGRLDAAIGDLTVYIERHPEDSRAHTKRGVRHIWNGDLEAAKRDLTRAIALDPRNAEAHDDLGVIYAHNNQLDRALRHFRKTVALDPSYQKGYHNLATALFLDDRLAAALEAVNTSLRLSPGNRGSLLLKGQILLKAGKEAQAKAIFEQAEFAPDHTDWTERFPVR